MELSVISQNQKKDKKICSTYIWHSNFDLKIGLQNPIYPTFVITEAWLARNVLVVTKSLRYTIQKYEEFCLEPSLCLEFKYKKKNGKKRRFGIVQPSLRVEDSLNFNNVTVKALLVTCDAFESKLLSREELTV